MPTDLIIISGASSGIGLATARRFAQSGAHVINFDRRRPAAGDEVGRWVEVDVADWPAVQDAVDAVTAEYGTAGVVIANAGISRRRPLLNITEQDARDVIGTNLIGVLALWQAAARHMVRAEKGVLLATASTNGSVGYPHYADYNATKAAVLSLCKTFALELAPHIRAVCVSPGYVLTPMQRAEYSDQLIAEVNRKIPARRHADPAEIAEAFFFLASPAASYITGQQLVVDGGELAGGTASSHGNAFTPAAVADPNMYGQK